MTISNQPKGAKVAILEIKHILTPDYTHLCTCVDKTSVLLLCPEPVPIVNGCQQLEAWNDCRFAMSRSHSLCVALSLSLSTRRTPHSSPWQHGPGIFASESISLHAGQRRPSPPTCSGCPASPFPTVSSLLCCSPLLDSTTWEFTQSHAQRQLYNETLLVMSYLWLIYIQI